MKGGQHYKVKKMSRGDIKEFINTFDAQYKSGQWKRRHVVSSNHMSSTLKMSKPLL